MVDGLICRNYHVSKICLLHSEKKQSNCLSNLPNRICKDCQIRKIIILAKFIVPPLDQKAGGTGVPSSRSPRCSRCPGRKRAPAWASRPQASRCPGKSGAWAVFARARADSTGSGIFFRGYLPSYLFSFPFSTTEHSQYFLTCVGFVCEIH